jgi:hypothetical protein
MPKKIKDKILNYALLLLASMVFMPVTVFADPPTSPPPGPTSADIRGATCAGSDITITSDPSNKACEDIKQSPAANKLVKEIINIFSAVIGIVAVIMIMVAGFRYVTSGGKDDAVKSAKNTILYAVIGLVVVALAQIIVHFVLSKVSQVT